MYIQLTGAQATKIAIFKLTNYARIITMTIELRDKSQDGLQDLYPAIADSIVLINISLILYLFFKQPTEYLINYTLVSSLIQSYTMMFCNNNNLINISNSRYSNTPLILTVMILFLSLYLVF